MDCRTSKPVPRGKRAYVACIEGGNECGQFLTAFFDCLILREGQAPLAPAPPFNRVPKGVEFQYKLEEPES